MTTDNNRGNDISTMLIPNDKKNNSKLVTFRVIKTGLKIKSANNINISIIVVSLLKQLIYIYTGVC